MKRPRVLETADQMGNDVLVSFIVIDEPHVIRFHLPELQLSESGRRNNEGQNDGDDKRKKPDH
jgi:hypothetical protein